jgi:DNA-binding MarR family transcriptional regulator
MVADNHRVHRVTKFLSALRAIDEQLPIQCAEILFYIASNPGCTSQDIAHQTRLTVSSVSRNLMALGQMRRDKTIGYNFIETVDDPRDRRRRIIFLTPRGSRFVAKLLGTLYPSDGHFFESPTAREYLRGSGRNLRDTGLPR